MYLRTARFYNNLHQVRPKPKYSKVKSFKKSLGASKPRDLNKIANINRIAKISKGHICMTEENLSDDSNYTTCSAI